MIPKLAAFVLICSLTPLHGADELPPFGLDHRIPWTTSRVAGSPEPPSPYTVEKTFTNVTWKTPIFLIPEPGTEWLWVVQAGDDKRPSKIVRLRDDLQADHVEA